MKFKKSVITITALSIFLNHSLPYALAQDSQNLNFKVYQGDSNDDAASNSADTPTNKPGSPNLFKEEPVSDNTNTSDAPLPNDGTSTKASDKVASQANDSTNNTESSDSAEKTANSKATASDDTGNSNVSEDTSSNQTNTNNSNETASSDKADSSETADDKNAQTANANDSADDTETTDGEKTKIANKVLQGYVRVVPVGTKIPIIMDTAVDSDTSQESDEFSARTAEDLDIDGQVAVPAGSIIRGRIAKLNPPKHLNRSGSVALKFDTVTTPDNRQIPIVANLVARGGIVHAKRGLKDVVICSSMVVLPAALGVGIGYLAGSSASSSIGKGGGALIGAGVGAAIGVAIFLAKKGKKVEVRPGDELKIELGEDLRMPMM